MDLPRRDDLNREDTTGIGYLNCNIKRGVRQSSAEAFLKPIRRRPNLEVVTDTLVEKVSFDGTRAVGVLTRRDGVAQEYRGREIILSRRRIAVAEDSATLRRRSRGAAAAAGH